jgi:hypothetical protein
MQLSNAAIRVLVQLADRENPIREESGWACVSNNRPRETVICCICGETFFDKTGDFMDLHGSKMQAMDDHGMKHLREHNLLAML